MPGPRLIGAKIEVRNELQVFDALKRILEQKGLKLYNVLKLSQLNIAIAISFVAEMAGLDFAKTPDVDAFEQYNLRFPFQITHFVFARVKIGRNKPRSDLYAIRAREIAKKETVGKKGAAKPVKSKLKKPVRKTAKKK